jgi:hypothetical protein
MYFQSFKTDAKNISPKEMLESYKLKLVRYIVCILIMNRIGIKWLKN